MSILEAQELIVDIPGRADGAPFSAKILPGQRWGVLGPNGAGKTSLLLTLAGLKTPRSGRVLLDDVPLHRLRPREIARKLGIVFQERPESFPATVFESVLIGRHPYLSFWQREGSDDVRLAEEAMHALSLTLLKDRLLQTLSGGERQRVAIATALVQQPAIWLADEPTNHLDLHHQVAVLKLLQQQAAQGAGVFMCLHDLNLAARWCDHILMVYPEGELCFGPSSVMLQPEALERLYNQKLTVAYVDDVPVFVPE
ncbi:ABC transporter ATP-binding protein [Alcanivorax sp. DP30]|uniref:ABC transporter ATP-binding protein n=1 Tax=Alcanivorax sp. DP30 TaxID=2606217 RepID=UPI00136C2719|nr:ABC transporter ATP-binding protein [Alcanivorax sp. DP30]MZR64482.1 ATP-binding cassette domain-containing protein [Alcanivorax sp. DP30]